MSFLSQIFILSPRGDTIIMRDYRHDVPRTAAETFFRKVKFWGIEGEEAPPIFIIEGVNYIHIKMGGLLLCGCTRLNIAPSLAIELLQRCMQVIKDYCGVLDEPTLQKNFVLVYELLDELVDYGYAQTTNTQELKMLIHNTPVTIAPSVAKPRTLSDSMRIPRNAVQKSIVSTQRTRTDRDEIFVDVIERINVVFNVHGYMQTSEVNGSIQMKSYLSGTHPVRLALNDNIGIGRGAQGGAGMYGMGVQLDDCNFHELVQLESFERDRSLTLSPPAGEISVMNYRCTNEFQPPFKVYPAIEENGAQRLDIFIKLRVDIIAKHNAHNVLMTIPLPKSTVKVTTRLGDKKGTGAEYKDSSKTLECFFKKVPGETEHTLSASVSLSQPVTGSTRKEVGPINLSFTVPMLNVSGLQVRYLQVLNNTTGYNPYRWVRYVTQSNSYVIRT